MPLKNDAFGKRFVELEIELPGTPEQIWQPPARFGYEEIGWSGDAP